MTSPLTDIEDVQAALVRPLTDTESTYIDNLIIQASALLRTAAPSIDARIAAFNADPTNPAGVSPDAVSSVVAGVLKRYLSNPRGLTSTTDGVGPFSHSESYALRGDKEKRGTLEITQDDLNVLFPVRKRLRARTIKLRPGLAPRPVGGYGPPVSIPAAYAAAIEWSQDPDIVAEMSPLLISDPLSSQ